MQRSEPNISSTSRINFLALDGGEGQAVTLKLCSCAGARHCKRDERELGHKHDRNDAGQGKYLGRSVRTYRATNRV